MANTYPFVNIVGKTAGGVSKPVLVDSTGALQVDAAVVITPGDAALGYHKVAAGSGDAANVAAAPAIMYTVDVFNKSAVPIYVKFHNTAGTPTPGAAVVMTIGVQAGVGRVVTFPVGRNFTAGIGISIVTGIANSNSSGVTADDCVVDVAYLLS